MNEPDMGVEDDEVVEDSAASLTQEQLTALVRQAVLFHRRNYTVEMIEGELIAEGAHPSMARSVTSHIDRYMAAQKKRRIGLLITLGCSGLTVVLMVLAELGISGSRQYIIFFGLLIAGCLLYVKGRDELDRVKESMIEASINWQAPVANE